MAEGLETPTQLEALRVIGCDYAQGFLLGRPLPAELIGDNPADDLTAWQAHRPALIRARAELARVTFVRMNAVRGRARRSPRRSKSPASTPATRSRTTRGCAARRRSRGTRELGYWAVAKHADVVAISRDPETFCSGKGILTFEIGVEYPSPPTMMHTDPPDHTRYRKLVQPGFAPSRMRALATRVRARADELVARIEPGKPFDAVETLAVPFPLWIIAELLGIPESDWHRFYQWSEASIPGATDWPPEECQRLQAEMHEYLLDDHAGAPRGDPRDDIISVLAHAEVDGESLRDDELVMFLNQLLVAGNETTRHAISGGIAALAERPDQWQRLADDRSLLDTATEEILRWTTPVISFMRTATRDTADARRRHRGRRPAAAAVRVGQPRRRRVRPGRRRVRRRAATRTTRSRWASARTSASAPRSRASRSRPCSTRCSIASRRSSRPATSSAPRRS